jgi:serine acetyltransferase
VGCAGVQVPPLGALVAGVWRGVAASARFVTRKVVDLTGISIATSAEIGPGLYIGHFGGIVVGGEVVAGEN